MNEKIPVRKRIGALFIAASFPAFTLFLFAPLHIYLTNRAEFRFGILDITPLLAAVCLAATCAVTLLLLPLPPRLFRAAVALLFAAGVGFWIQGNLLVWRVGVLDGREIPWGAHRVYGWVDGAMWAALLATAVWRREFVFRIARGGSAAFLLIQLLSTAVTTARAPGELNFYRYTSDETDKFTFSNKRNVILLVLDQFQSDIFQDLLSGDGEFRGAFTGFTYFRNTLGGYPTTYPSVLLILTGKYYDNSVPIQRFMENAYAERNIPATLRQEGWRVYLQRHLSILNDERIASNIRKRAPEPLRVENIGYAAILYDASLVRYAPYFAKGHFYNDGRGFFRRMCAQAGGAGGGPWWTIGDWSLEPSVKFIEGMEREGRVGDGPGTFSYFHLVGTHIPFTLNERMEYEEMPTTRENYLRQGRGALRIAERFIAKLKALGLYDSSMIFVMSDHGSSFRVPASFCAAQGGAPRVGGEHPVVSDLIIPQGLPLLMVKPFNAGGALRVSDAPVTVGDVTATVASALGMGKEFTGESVFARGESEDRERRFLLYYWGDHRWTEEYLPLMTEYAVRGPSGCRESWAPTGRRFPPGGGGAGYAWGTEIGFGAGGSYLRYALEGWSLPQEGYTWTEEARATLVMPVEPPRGDMVMRAVLKPWIPPGGKREYQRVIVEVNGETLGTWEVTPVEREYRMTIPARLLGRPTLTISFLLPDRASPRDAGLGDDMRTLGVAVRSVVIGGGGRCAETPYAYGTKIAFGRGGNAVHYTGAGWSEPEDRYTWTIGTRASLRILREPSPADLVLRAYVRPMSTGRQPDVQRVYIGVNGKRVGEWRVGRGGEYEVAIPAGFVQTPEAIITFDMPDAVSPLSRGKGDDPRVLGLCFSWVRLMPGGATPSP